MSTISEEDREHLLENEQERRKVGQAQNYTVDALDNLTCAERTEILTEGERAHLATARLALRQLADALETRLGDLRRGSER
jgi:hypothetical protein